MFLYIKVKFGFFFCNNNMYIMNINPSIYSIFIHLLFDIDIDISIHLSYNIQLYLILL